MIDVRLASNLPYTAMLMTGLMKARSVAKNGEDCRSLVVPHESITQHATKYTTPLKKRGHAPSRDLLAVKGNCFIMRSHAAERLEVHVTEPGRLHDLLNGAEAVLRQMPQRGTGILVTRHDPFRYTLALSDKVPFGETREQVLS